MRAPYGTLPLNVSKSGHIADDPTRTELDDERGRSGRPLRLLVVLDDGMVSHSLPRSGLVVVGRVVESGIQVDDPGISRRHFALSMGAETTVTDLGSKNGVQVRGKRIEPNETVVLSPGDALRAGRVLFLLQEDSCSELPSEGPSAAVSDVVFRGAALEPLWDVARRAAKAPISVLITGETGVGKEVLAKAVHLMSPRAKQPFVRLNCAALPEALLESELFGYERGAFTGAAQRKLGLLETAHGGTVFLDELGEMALPIQAKLLQVIEEKQVRRVGGLKANRIDVRFISATNRNLDDAVDKGTFRRDLLFRLNGLSLVIPPLRERLDEIAPLANGFIDASFSEFGLRTRPVLSPEALTALRAHAWPGNIRELKNVIDRALVLCRGNVIQVGDLRLESDQRAMQKNANATVTDAIQQRESDEVIQALARFAGNQSRAARALGIARGTLIARMERYGIPRPRKE
jgi:transcriptional regulator with PAS, ATPase and Fis domain